MGRYHQHLLRGQARRWASTLILYPGIGLTRRSRIVFGLVSAIKAITIRMRVKSFENVEEVIAVEYDTTQTATVEGIPRP